MVTCPRCRQPVQPRALLCPACQTSLKAYGHPGVTLHQAVGTESLCETCLYDQDDSCTYPQRPHARDCTMYSDRYSVQLQRKLSSQARLSFLSATGFRRYSVWLVFIGLILISFWMAIQD
jgi:hypothetical protein